MISYCKCLPLISSCLKLIILGMILERAISIDFILIFVQAVIVQRTSIKDSSNLFKNLSSLVQSIQSMYWRSIRELVIILFLQVTANLQPSTTYFQQSRQDDSNASEWSMNKKIQRHFLILLSST